LIFMAKDRERILIVGGKILTFTKNSTKIWNKKV